MESEVEGEKETAFLAASAAGGMPERVPPAVFTGVDDNGGTASSRSRFLQEHAGGTGIEAAVAWRNSASTVSIFLTQASMVGSIEEKTGHEQRTP